MTVERATRADAKKIAELEKRYIDCPWTAEQVISEIEKPTTVFFKAVEGGLVGYISGEIAAGECEIANVAVDERYRRRGIAEALISALIAEAAARGAAEIFLLVREDNAPAKALYDKVGFAAVGTRRGYYNGKDAIIMRFSAKE